LERAAPDKPTQPDSVAKHEFEYIRHGTTTLIGNWDVVAGQMFACTLGEHADRTGLCPTHRSNRGDRPPCAVGVRGGLPERASVRRLGGVGGQDLRTGSAVGKKRETRHPGIASHAACVLVGPDASHPLRVSTET